MFPEGAFVRCNFPFGSPPEARSRPGPSMHIVYYLGREPGFLMVAYTSSGPWRGTATGTPPGVVEVGDAEAARVGQRAFHIDLRCLARVLPDVAWFPDWSEPGHGLVGTADQALKDRILAEAIKVARSGPHVVEVRGVVLPRTGEARR